MIFNAFTLNFNICDQCLHSIHAFSLDYSKSVCDWLILINAFNGIQENNRRTNRALGPIVNIFVRYRQYLPNCITYLLTYRNIP